MRQSLPERLHSRNWRLQGLRQKKGRGKSIAQVTDLAQSDAHATEPPKNDGTAATPSTPDQLIGFAASVKQIPVKSVARLTTSSPHSNYLVVITRLQRMHWLQYMEISNYVDFSG
jgi:hypothetical protein